MIEVLTKDLLSLSFSHLAAGLFCIIVEVLRNTVYFTVVGVKLIELDCLGPINVYVLK